MKTIQRTPGQAADRAFRLGVFAFGICGLVVVAFMYWGGVLSPTITGYVLVTLYPVYLVGVATALSVWLGYNKDVTSLRPVHRDRESR